MHWILRALPGGLSGPLGERGCVWDWLASGSHATEPEVLHYFPGELAPEGTRLEQHPVA